MKFRLSHGFAASLVLHGVLCMPFVFYAVAAPEQAQEKLVIDLQGIISESQIDEKVQQETRGVAGQSAAETAKPTETAAAQPPAPQQAEPETNDKEAPPEPQKAAPDTPPPVAVAAPAEVGTAARDVVGAENRQVAQTIQQDRDAELDRLKDYVKLLTKRVRVNLVYPDAGRRAGLQGVATVSFSIQDNGQIRPDSLKIVVSSGQARLDASALKSVRASAPFDPPPQDMTVAIPVEFGAMR